MYEKLLNQVEKPSQYLGNEINSIRKHHDRCAVTWALSYPDLYEVGMSNTGLPILYFLLNEIEDVVAERVFLPALDMQHAMREASYRLTSLETRRPLIEFDLLGIQLPHEMCYTNLVTLLRLADIPIRSADRDERHPIVLGGGPGAFAPEPVAPLYDALAVGDGEDLVVDVTNCVREAKAEGVDREELLERLARIEGIYVPSHFEVDYLDDGRVASIRARGGPHRKTSVPKALVADLEAAYYPDRAIVPYTDTVHSRLGVEIMRGCTVGCRFCQAGMIYRPLRERSPGKILELADRGLCSSGFEDVSLLSLDTGDYTLIDPLARRLLDMTEERRISASLPSLRAGSLTDDTIREIKRVRRTGFTIAPEAGTQRLRDVINKNISQEEVFDTVERVVKQGWTAIKFYFMCGQPTETDEDLDGIFEMAMEARALAQKFVRRFQITVSLGAHVPKPHTPFQWEEQIGVEEANRRLKRVGDKCRAQGIKFKSWPAEVSWLEGVFSRGDRRLFDAVVEAEKRGAGFDSWADHFRKDIWESVFADLGVDAMWYHRRRDWAEVLPWDHIDSRVTKKYLLTDIKKVYRELRDPSRTELRTTADCRDDSCTGCAVCFEGDIRNRLAKYDPDPFKEGAPGRRLPMVGEIAFPDNRKWQTKPGIPGAEGPAPHYLDGLADRDVDYLPSLSAGPIKEPLPAPEDAGDEVRSSYRITWTKTGDLRMLSHREIINVFYRALRRTGLLLQYTKGFHPKPKISFGPALPLGLESLCEEADIHLAQDLPPEQLIEAMTAVLPGDQGIAVVAARRLEKGETSVQASIDTQRYRVELPDLAGAAGADGRAALRAAVAELMASDTLAVQRNVGKRVSRTVNLRPMVVEMLLDEPPGNRFQGILAPAPALCFTTRIDDGGMCPRPRELLGALLTSWPEVLASARVTKQSVQALLTDTPEAELIEV